MSRRFAYTFVAIAIATFAAAFTQGEAPDLNGTWILRIEGSGGTNASTLELRHEAETLRGRNISNVGTVREIEGSVVGDSVRFAMPISTGTDRFVRYAGVAVTADSVAGAVDLAGVNEATFTAVRKK